jgi:hypothetical protein
MEYLPQIKKSIITREKVYADFVKTLHACYMDVYVFKKVSPISPSLAVTLTQ